MELDLGADIIPIPIQSNPILSKHQRNALILFIG
jgi:hypothetical protein